MTPSTHRPAPPRGTPAASPGRRRGDALFSCAILAALPFALLAVGPNWIVSALYNDPWIYFGYYLDLPAHMKAFDGQYYGNRLSVILPGWAAYRMLPPVAANLALHLGLYYAGLFAFHGILGRTVNRRAALLGAILLGTNSFYVNAVGQDYTDGYAIVYALLAMLCLGAAPGSSRWRILLFAAGVSTSAMVVAFLTTVLAVPSLLTFYVVANRGPGRRPWIASASWFGAGGLSLIAAFCAINRVLAGRYWFLAASFEFIRKQADAPNYFKDRSLSWVPSAVWLSVSILALLASLNGLRRGWRSGGKPASPPAIYYPIQLIAMVLLYAAFEIGSGSTILLPWFYANQLMPAAFLALGALLAGPVGTMSSRGFAATVLSTAAAALAFPALIAAGYPLSFAGIAPMALIVPLCAVAAVALPAPSSRAPRLAFFLLLFLAVEYAAQSGFRQEASVITLQKDPDCLRRGYLSMPPRAIEPYGERLRAYDRAGFDVLRAMAAGVRNVQKIDPTGRTRFWFNIEEPLGVFFNNLACTYTWGVRVLNLDFPALNDGKSLDLSPLVPGMQVVILSGSPQVFEPARKSLRESKLDGRPIAAMEVEEGTIRFWMTFFEVEKSAGGS